MITKGRRAGSGGAIERKAAQRLRIGQPDRAALGAHPAAARKGIDIAEAERYLAANLDYDPE